MMSLAKLEEKTDGGPPKGSRKKYERRDQDSFRVREKSRTFALNGIIGSLHIRWPKYWSFNISPSNEYSGLIYFMIDWFDLLTVQRTL